jgi:hypothetical protein
LIVCQIEFLVMTALVSGTDAIDVNHLSPPQNDDDPLNYGDKQYVVLVQDGIGMIDSHVITRRRPIVMKCCGIFVAGDSIVQEEEWVL